MRLATRTGLASLVAAAVTLVGVGAAFRGQFDNVLRERVDAQLEKRADTAPILAAISERLARSELRATVEGARVRDLVHPDEATIEIGALPAQPLPPVDGPGWSTARADGEAWRLYTVSVVDVPAVGDRALVQLVAPLGDVDAEAIRLRRRVLVVAALATLAAGAVGYAFGHLASRPLVSLQHDTERLDAGDPATWKVQHGYGSPEVDDVASTLNRSLERVADEGRRREAALASSRSFASSATHELRTPLQSARTQLDVAADARTSADDARRAVEVARDQLERMGAALGAVGALAQAELVDRSRFEAVDLAELADAVVAAQARRDDPVAVEVQAPDDATPVVVWRDGVELAIANLVRNARTHGLRADGAPARVTVRVHGSTIVVEDDGPGIAEDEREHVLERFVRGTATTVAGSGLGLAFVDQVARLHGGRVRIDTSALGGARIELTLAP